MEERTPDIKLNELQTKLLSGNLGSKLQIDIESSKFNPLRDQILVKPAPRKQGSIIDLSEEVSMEGTVVRLGKQNKNSKNKNVDFSVSIGDTITFAGRGGTKITFSDGEHLLMTEKEVIGRIV